MNTNILIKCLQELNKDKPDISYAKGILETFISLNSDNNAISITQVPHVPEEVSYESLDLAGEGGIVDLYNTGRVGKLS